MSDDLLELYWANRTPAQIRTDDEDEAIQNWLASWHGDWAVADNDIVLSALDYTYDYLQAAATISPSLLDRLWPEMWMPGINPEHTQARGLILSIPMWEQSGNMLHDLHSGNNFRLGG